MKNVLLLFLSAILLCFDSKHNIQPASKYVMLGQSKIYYVLEGQGKPPVVFVSGMAHDHRTWNLIQDSLSKETTTLSYDRSGLGVSEYHGEKKDITTMANEVNDVVTKVGIHQPFIFVAHSMGCQIVKKYITLYPKKVMGIVYIDPGYNEKFLKQRISDSLWHEREQMIKKYQPDFNAAQLKEAANHTNVNEEADRIYRVPQIPTILFTATMVTDFPASAVEQKVKMERHILWLNQMPKASHILINNSWHYIHLDAPNEVIKAIHSMVNRR
jgi:pimeloyl-ACP methyl ester carboxylesterase